MTMGTIMFCIWKTILLILIIRSSLEWFLMTRFLNMRLLRGHNFCLNIMRMTV